MRVLILEDEKKIRELLRLYIAQEGHDVEAFSYAEPAMEAFETRPFDLVISDLMLKGIQGENFIRFLREKRDVYVLVLTAKSGESVKLSLLKDGVDDFITKPFSLDEVLYKIRNIERRLFKEETQTFTYGTATYKLKADAAQVLKNGVAIKLNETEIQVLKFFMAHPNQLLSRDQIIDACLQDSEAFDRIVDTYVKNLRKKLDEKALIETVYGSGYRFRGEMDA